MTEKQKIEGSYNYDSFLIEITLCVFVVVDISRPVSFYIKEGVASEPRWVLTRSSIWMEEPSPLLDESLRELFLESMGLDKMLH